MYVKDKDFRITLRLNADQFGYVKSASDLLDVTPSEFLRMVINVTMVQAKDPRTADKIRQADLELGKVGTRRENETSIQHDQL